jgi:hypothetical protein
MSDVGMSDVEMFDMGMSDVGLVSLLFVHAESTVRGAQSL